MNVRSLTTVALALLALVGSASTVRACPFCTSVAQTFTEEMNSMQVVALGSLVEAPPVPDSNTLDPTAPLPKAKFQVTQVIKGQEFLQKDAVIEVLYFGEANRDRAYLLMGTDAPQIAWSTPLGLSPRAQEYILHLPKLAPDASRLEFFQEHLEDEDEMLTRDAYDEFAKAPYKDVIALGPKMHHDRLIEWIKDTEVPASRRRLYYTMLGVCGTADDVPLLQTMMLSDDRKVKAGLDALIACYLLLKGPEGMTLVEEKFLQNPKAEYADTYAAIMAIRFHGTETQVIPKPRLIQALRHLLERPELADLVIPDLARWEDWEVMPRLIQLFKDADDKSSWVRVPVVNYLRACPKPEAKAAIEELSKIDPDAVKRAQTFFPLDQGKATDASQPTGEQPKPAEQPKPDQSSFLVPPMPPAVFLPQPKPLEETSEATNASAKTSALASQPNAAPSPNEDRQENEATGRRPLARSATRAARAADPYESTLGQQIVNHRHFWSVPLLAGLALWSTFRGILGLKFWGVRG